MKNDKSCVCADLSFKVLLRRRVCGGQLQEVDERGRTLQSVGMHVVRLPFKEDIRTLNVPWTKLSLSRAFRAHCLPEDSRDIEGETESLADEKEAALLKSVEQAVEILASEDIAVNSPPIN